MRMPFPYCRTENHIQTERFLGKTAVTFTLLPEGDLFNPGEIDDLNRVADRVAAAPDQFLGEAYEKLAENHYREYERISHGERTSITAFKSGLVLQSVSVWADGSWAMVFQSEVGVLANNPVLASFPADRSSFTSLIGG